jgi:MFS transporter, ACS family, DAL5 transporter family protein
MAQPTDEPATEKAKDLHYEKVEIEGITEAEVVYTDAEERALVRKLDFWILPVLMITYGLQLYVNPMSSPVTTLVSNSRAAAGTRHF